MTLILLCRRPLSRNFRDKYEKFAPSPPQAKGEGVATFTLTYNSFFLSTRSFWKSQLPNITSVIPMRFLMSDKKSKFPFYCTPL